jgi:hypothetical protein
VRVEGILDGSMYVGKPNHLYIQRNLNIKLFTAQHIALFCTDETGRRQHLRVSGRLDYQQLIGTNSRAKRLAEWMI